MRSISKDGSISCECADFTAAVPLPVDVLCELILSAAASFDSFLNFCSNSAAGAPNNCFLSNAKTPY